MTPDVETAGRAPSAAAGAWNDSSMAKASAAAEQAWVKQLDIGFSWMCFSAMGQARALMPRDRG